MILWLCSVRHPRPLDSLLAPIQVIQSRSLLIFPKAKLTRSLPIASWDLNGRSQTLEVVQDGVVVATETLNAFSEGEYIVWEISGPATLRARRNAGANAVISGIFLDAPENGQPPAAAPAIDPAAGRYDSPIQVTLSSTTPESTIYYTLDGSTPTTASMVYTAPFPISTTTTLSARAFAPGMKASDISMAQYTIGSAASVATFLGIDNQTQGTWRGAYGNLGYVVARESQSLPSSASVSVHGASDHVWAYGVSDPAALQMAASDSRIASCWYAPASFEVDVNVTGGNSYSLELYFLDWDNAGRSMRVELIDFATGAILDTQNVNTFANGLWLKWAITGHIRVRFTSTSGPNAVLAGVFLD